MALVFIFPVLLHTLLHATSSGEVCLKSWTTETTKYNILNYRGELYVDVSCNKKNFKVDGDKLFKCIHGQLPEHLSLCTPFKESCPNLKAPTYGSMKCSSTVPDVRSRCTFACQSTHYLKGSSIRRCSQDLRWTGTTARCFLKQARNFPKNSTVRDFYRPKETLSDLCQVHNGNCSHHCHQNPNGIQCSCRNGYKLAEDGTTCIDIDECSDEKKFGCSHICVNVPGSAHCACPPGYQLKEDKNTCIDINECSIQNGGCDGICHNTDGNFTCSCPEGYVASSEDKYSCNDVDECSEGNGGCDGQCVNYDGGFHCICPEGLRLHFDGKTCVPCYCPQVLVPHHSSLRCKNNTVSSKAIFHPGKMPEDKEFPVGTTCKVKCNKGYGIRDSPPAIICQKDGKWNASLPECQVLHCPRLIPPSNGDVYPPSCKEGSVTVKEKCVFTCLSGYRITGQEVLTCRNNLSWSKKKPTQCVPETEVSISCPNDDITMELLPNESWIEMQLNSPRTTPEAGPITISPAWVSLDRVSLFPPGETKITFSVTSHNKTAECSIDVIVLDKHPPVFHNCPTTLFVKSSIVGTAVNWEEPIPEDNVGIASVSKNMELNSTLTPGLYFVEYVARDYAGNIGLCLFHINVTADDCKDLMDPENGEANCLEWMSGKICQPTCFDNFTRPSELFSCDESGKWTPTPFISPCLPQCFEDEMWSPELKKCIKI